MSESKSMRKFYTKDKAHYITVASWEGEFGLSYEVGLRCMKNGNFVLAASYLKSEDEAAEIAQAVGVLAEAGWSLDKISGIFPSLFK